MPKTTHTKKSTAATLDADGRDWIEIQSFLKRKGITQREIGRRAGVNKGLVSRTLRGQRNNRKVLKALKHAGVPAHLVEVEE